MKTCYRFILLLAAAFSLLTVAESHAVTWTVNVANFSFSPKNLTISEGDIVRWEWISGTHTTTSGSGCSSNGLWNASITSSNQSFQRQFNSAGSFPYYCQPHCFSGMTGNITVEMATGILDGGGDAAIPGGFDLGQNYPNPFNAGTVIRYTIPHDTHVKLVVYDILGRTVAVLSDDEQSAGPHEVNWDGTDRNGAAVPSGIYFYRLDAGPARDTKKMILLR